MPISVSTDQKRRNKRLIKCEYSHLSSYHIILYHIILYHVMSSLKQCQMGFAFTAHILKRKQIFVTSKKKTQKKPKEKKQDNEDGTYMVW